MDKEEIRHKLKIYADLIGEHFPFEKLVLYGSHAKNVFNNDSDIDVAVIVKNKNMDLILSESLLWQLAAEVDSRIEPMIFDEDNDPIGFLADILKHGEVIVSN